MKIPVYCIINGIAVKAMRSNLLRLEIYRYCPENDEFKLDMQYMEHIYFPTETKSLDTYIVTKKEFEEYIERLREEYRKNAI